MIINQSLIKGFTMAELTEEQSKAVREYEASVKQVQKCQTARTGGTGAEAVRQAAYSELVRLGLAPVLKAKLRAGKAHKQVR
jgi:hypothetical protein